MMVRFAFIINCARYFHWVYWVVLEVVAFLSLKSPISSCSSCIVLYWKVPRCPNRGGLVCNLFSVFCSFQHIFSFCSWTVFSIICCEAFLFCLMFYVPLISRRPSLHLEVGVYPMILLKMFSIHFDWNSSPPFMVTICKIYFFTEF